MDSFVPSTLLGAACDAAQYAYAPYSEFRVGAALLTSTGEIVTGCNVENASYGLSICAERVAAFKGVSGGFTEWIAMAVYTPTNHPAAPCGACRQVLWQFAPDLQLILGGDCPEIQITTLRELLPGAFEL